MARPSRAHEIEAALLRAAGEHPRDLVRMVAAQLGLTRQRIHSEVRRLVDDGYLLKEGSTRPTYRLGPNRRFLRTYLRQGLAEDRVWFNDLLPLLADLRQNILEITHYGVSEMVNNAIDHSDANDVTVAMDCSGDHLSLGVIDEGVGIFKKIARSQGLADERLALLELSKGKLTTDPNRHSGEGIFFTSRVFDRFSIMSGGLFFDHDENLDDILDELSVEAPRSGTTVLMGIALESDRTIKEIFDEFSSGPDDYDFSKTIVPMRLATIGPENLVSRSQAKRVLQRVDRFRTVIFDFDGVTRVGQAFADEIFRVFANSHPQIELNIVNAASSVQQMIRRAEIARDNPSGQMPLLP